MDRICELSGKTKMGLLLETWRMLMRLLIIPIWAVSVVSKGEIFIYISF